MTAQTAMLNPEFRWETLGDDVVALDTSASCVYRLTGVSAVVARHLLNGTAHHLIPEEYSATLDCLVQQGLARVDNSAISRRTMVRTATAVAMGITVLMLPAAPAAASGIAQGSGSGDPLAIVDPSSTTTTTLVATTTTTPATTTTVAPVNDLPAPSVTSFTSTGVTWTQPNE